MSSSFDISTTFDALDDSLVSDVFDLDSWTSSLSPPVASDEPIRHSTPHPRQKRHVRMRGYPHPTPAVVLPSAAIVAGPVLSTPAVASASTWPGVPARVDKGKGRQQTTPAPSPASSVDSSPIPATASVDLTPEQHVCLVRMLKHLDEWLARGWQPGVDQSRLRSLAEIFDSTEAVASGGIADLRLADLTWRLADSEGWEKNAGSSILGAIDIQVSVTKILYKDYGDALIDSFRSFLGQKEVELGNSGRSGSAAGLPLSSATGHRNSEPVVPKRVRFQGLDSSDGGTCNVRLERDAGGGLLVDAPDAHIPPYDEACRSLAQHLAFVGGASYGTWRDFLLELRKSTPGANALHSLHAVTPLPDLPFVPLCTGSELRYQLAGRGTLTDTHPLGRYRCFRCNTLGHWSSDHDRTHGRVYGGPPHSGVLPDPAR